MTDNPSKLQNIQLPTEPSDGLASGIVEPDGSTGGTIDSGASPSAAKKNIQCRRCNCKYAAFICYQTMTVIWDCEWIDNPPKDCQRIAAQRDLS